LFAVNLKRDQNWRTSEGNDVSCWSE